MPISTDPDWPPPEIAEEIARQADKSGAVENAREVLKMAGGPVTLMVERVARALAEWDRGPGAFDKAFPPSRAMWVGFARAAIEAMRPWGQELQDRGANWDGEVNFGGHLDMYGFASVWEAGIDEALKEKP